MTASKSKRKRKYFGKIEISENLEDSSQSSKKFCPTLQKTRSDFWQNNVWMEILANNLFETPSHEGQPEESPTSVKEEFIPQDIVKTDIYDGELQIKNGELDFSYLDIQKCVEIDDKSGKLENVSLINNCKAESVVSGDDNQNSNDSGIFSFAGSPSSFYRDHSYSTYKSETDNSPICFMDHDYGPIKEERNEKNAGNFPVLENFDEKDIDMLMKQQMNNTLLTLEEEYDLEEEQGVSDGEISISMKCDSDDHEEDIPEVREKPVLKRIHRCRDVIVGDSVIVEDKSWNETGCRRRLTRQLAKDIELGKPLKIEEKNFVPGNLVWAFLRGWWPALVIEAKDAGMASTEGKLWVCWLGELQISELSMKNVEPFANNLEDRLENYLKCSKTVTVKSANKKVKQKSDVCLATIKLLRSYFGAGPLIKPYTSWMKMHILPNIEKLDDMVFYPYPEDVQNKLYDVRDTNYKKTLRFLKQEEEKKTKKLNEPGKATRKKEEKEEKQLEVGAIPIIDQIPGVIAWAKMSGYSWWPCVVMDFHHLNRRQAQVACQWVMWYGDYKYSQIEYRHIITFEKGMEKMESKFKGCRDEIFSKAVVQASKDYAAQFGHSTEEWMMEDVIEYFYSEVEAKCAQRKKETFTPYEEIYSPEIRNQLRKQIKNQNENTNRKKEILYSKELRSILKREEEFDTLCAGCLKTDEDLVQHPFFYASLCEECLDILRSKLFAFGNDSKCFYCTLCGSEELVAMCDNMDCPRVFCTACIKYIISPEYYQEILLEHPWSCFLCNPRAKCLEDSILKVREDWKKRLMSLYKTKYDDEPTSKLQHCKEKRKMRVFSAFDGISTGLVILKKLEIDLECYYASEIDEDSMLVSYTNHGDEVIQLGDIREIDEKKIKEICPIDLFIGGSPCNDLSMANPKRRGLTDPEGTGVLFFEYTRLKKLIEKHNKKRPLFWLFENVASMPSQFRYQINDYLGREPQFLDSADFSPQHRPRLFWSNLPWGPYEVIPSVLQDVLTKKCNRYALVKKIMTVTTRTNSLNQGKDNVKPILMNGKRDMLWVTELEAIFGLPLHYTDANIARTKRLKLIGKAWSVQTLTAVLQPLKFFFLTKTPAGSTEN